MVGIIAINNSNSNNNNNNNNNVPSLKTRYVDNITNNSASSGGIDVYSNGNNGMLLSENGLPLSMENGFLIIIEGDSEDSSTSGSSITSHGLLWSTSTPLDITSYIGIVNNGNLNGVAFSNSMTGLQAGTKYYVRAYAVNSSGFGYGNIQEFFTLPNRPVIETGLPTSTTYDSFSVSGSILNANDIGVVFEKGFVYSVTNTTPSMGQSNTFHVSSGAGTSNWSQLVSNLKHGTRYYVSAYVQTQYGVTYGNVRIVVTNPISVGDYYQGGIVGGLNPLFVFVEYNATKRTLNGIPIPLVISGFVGKGYLWSPRSISDNNIYKELDSVSSHDHRHPPLSYDSKNITLNLNTKLMSMQSSERKTVTSTSWVGDVYGTRINGYSDWYWAGHETTTIRGNMSIIKSKQPNSLLGKFYHSIVFGYDADFFGAYLYPYHFAVQFNQIVTETAPPIDLYRRTRASNSSQFNYLVTNYSPSSGYSSLHYPHIDNCMFFVRYPSV